MVAYGLLKECQKSQTGPEASGVRVALRVIGSFYTCLGHMDRGEKLWLDIDTIATVCSFFGGSVSVRT